MRQLVLAVIVALCLEARPVQAYSVLAHESTIDVAWDAGIAPLLRARFPKAAPDDIRRARAFAYGGAVVQDLGYYPFGSSLFTKLTHYVRSGDFIEALVRQARDVNEYAFALGSLAHYAADNAGHAIAVNRAVPIIYPKLRAKHGDEVTYADSPKHHIMVEFSFDVLQVARGTYVAEAYKDMIGFEMAKPVMERAFQETYALEMSDLFMDLDLALGTFRFAVGELIPRITEAAWKDKQDEIEKLTPGITRERFVYGLNRRQYEEHFGKKYRRRGFMVRFLGVIVKILPKVGPLKPLAFETPTPEAERLFEESLLRTRERYRSLLQDVGRGALALANVDFDTGRPTAPGEYPLADEAYADLVEKLADRRFEGVTPALRAELVRYGQGLEAAHPTDRKQRKLVAETCEHLALLAASPQP